MKSTSNFNASLANRLLPTLLFSLALIAVLFVSGCKGDDPLPATEQVKQILTSTTSWKMQTVQVDGTDQTAVYKGLTLGFTDTGFSSTNGGAVWPASGTWKFTDDTATAIFRNDGLQITIDTATETKLVLRLTWTKTTLGPGRVASMKGVNVFTFGK